MNSCLFILSLLTITPSNLDEIDYDPLIDSLIKSVSADSVHQDIASLSGEIPVIISGEADSLPTRYAYSPGAHRAALWLAEQLESEGIHTELRAFVPVLFGEVELLPSGNGWACGFNGLWWRDEGTGLFNTRDAGASWELIESISGNAWQGVEVVSEDTVFLVDSRGRLMRSVDGASFQEMKPHGIPLYDVYASTSSRSWAVGDSGSFLATADAWSSYTDEKVTSANLRHVAFLDASTGWIASPDSLWLTDDAGQTWSYLESPLEGICDLTLLDSALVITGINSQGHGACYLTRRSSDWDTLIDTLIPIPRAASAQGSDTLWLAGDAGLILFSSDQGESWERRMTHSNARFTTVAPGAGGNAVAAGEEEILFTSDGFTWQRPDTLNLGLMHNVVGTIPGEDSVQVLLTAHYDARSEDISYTPGADDNGSGCAAVLAGARKLSSHTRLHTIRLVFFACEELGVFGSRSYVSRAVGSGEDIMAVLNADMFAYDGNRDRAVEVNSNPEDAFAQQAGRILTEVIEIYDLDLAPTHHIADARSNSDHRLFWEAGIPAVHLGEDREDFNPFYHTTGDRLQNLDLGQATEGVRAALGWTAHLVSMDELQDVQEPEIGETEPVTLRLSQAVAIDKVQLRVSSPYPLRLNLYDASGRKVKSLPYITEPSATLTIDLSDLPTGVYWVAGKIQKGTVSAKFVKLR